MSISDALDVALRQQIYQVCLQRGTPPLVTELSDFLSLSSTEIRAGLHRLAAGRIIVLQAEGGEILMANPFSAVPTSFRVELKKYSCYANCIWDALGVAAMLQQDIRIVTSCADCGTAMLVQTIGGKLDSSQGIIHFAIPALNWWDDIVFT